MTPNNSIAIDWTLFKSATQCRGGRADVACVSCANNRWHNVGGASCIMRRQWRQRRRWSDKSPHTLNGSIVLTWNNADALQSIQSANGGRFRSIAVPLLLGERAMDISQRDCSFGSCGKHWVMRAYTIGTRIELKCIVYGRCHRLDESLRNLQYFHLWKSSFTNVRSIFVGRNLCHRINPNPVRVCHFCCLCKCTFHRAYRHTHKHCVHNVAMSALCLPCGHIMHFE